MATDALRRLALPDVQRGNVPDPVNEQLLSLVENQTFSITRDSLNSQVSEEHIPNSCRKRGRWGNILASQPLHRTARKRLAGELLRYRIWRCGLDHRQDAGADRLGQIGPGGHDGGAHSPRSFNSSNSSYVACVGKLASDDLDQPALDTHPPADPTAPMMKARSGSST